MSVAADFVEALQPWMTDDLNVYATAVGQMFVQIEKYVSDDPNGDGSDGWSVVLDVNNCPYEALPYLAQWVGERLPTGLSDADARRWITDGPQQRRGTPVSIARAAQRHLTGNRVVQILERTKANGTADPNGDEFIVYTYTSQTPDSNQVWLDLLDVIPADMICHYATLSGATWAGLQQGAPTWTSLDTQYGTWAAMQSATPGASVWTR